MESDLKDRIWRLALAQSKLSGLTPAETRRLYQTLLSQAQGKEQ